MLPTSSLRRHRSHLLGKSSCPRRGNIQIIVLLGLAILCFLVGLILLESGFEGIRVGESSSGSTSTDVTSVDDLVRYLSVDDPGEVVLPEQLLLDQVVAPDPVAPIVIQVMNSHFFGSGYERKIPDCFWNDQLLDCEVTKRADPASANTTALMWHLPTLGWSSSVLARHPGQFLVGMTMESAQYYPNMEDQKFMKSFDIRMTYELDSDVPMLYSNEWVNQDLFAPARPVQEKENAIVYLNSNCSPRNNRDVIVKALLGIGIVPVHSYGRCMNNRHMPRDNDKLKLFSRYRFCIAMENSNSRDYVSEKLWQALRSGCLPIYYGAPNIADFLPVPVNEIILDYNAYGSPEKLADEIHRLSTDDNAYERMFDWRNLTLEQTLPGFQYLVEIANRGHSQCVLCQEIAKRQAERTRLARVEATE